MNDLFIERLIWRSVQELCEPVDWFDDFYEVMQPIALSWWAKLISKIRRGA